MSFLNELIAFFDAIKQLSSRDDDDAAALPHFQTKPVLQDEHHRVFFDALQTVVGDDFRVWVRPRLSDILQLSNASSHLALAIRFERVVVPFVICDSLTMRPRLVVHYHVRKYCKERKRARKLDARLGKVGLPTIHIQHDVNLSAASLGKQIHESLETVRSPSPSELARHEIRSEPTLVP